MSLYDFVNTALNSSSKDINKAFGIDPKGGERDTEGNLTEEGEEFFAPIWDEDVNEPLEDFYEFRWNDKFTEVGSDNPILNPGGQLSDPGNFLTSDELSQSEPSERSASAAAIAAVIYAGIAGGAGSAAGEAGATGVGTTGTGTSTTGALSEAAAASGVAGGGAEALTAGEILAAGSTTGESLAPATGASEGASGSFLSEYGLDIVETGADYYESDKAKKAKMKELADARANKRVRQNAAQSNLASALSGTETADVNIPDASIQYGESPDPIPIVPTPIGEEGPDSITTIETAEGTTTTVKKPGKGIPGQKRSPYGTSSSLESIPKSENFYNELLGGQDGSI